MTSLVERRLASFRAVLMQSDAEIRAQYPEYFLTYYTYLRIIRNPPRIEHVIQKGQDMYRYLEAEGKDILDLGAGFGLEALLVAIFGARRVVATEIDHDMVEVGRYLAERMDPPMTNFESKYGDGIAMQFPSASFDGIMTNCVISHVRDLEGFLRETSRLLKPGGIFFLSDENNSLYLPARGRRRRGWRSMEAEPHGPFFAARMAYIGEHFPQIQENELLDATRITRGLIGKEILQSVGLYRETRRPPKPPSFLYRHPLDGQYPERELNPWWLMRQFRDAGLTPELLPAFFSRKIENNPRQWVKDILRFLTSAWPALSVYVWPIMRLRGRKPVLTPSAGGS